MADTQSFANHVHRPKLWLVAALAAVLAFSVTLLLLLRVPDSIVGAALMALSIAVICLVVMMRRYMTRLQDRVIRLEMRLRLAALGRERDLARLHIKQMVALRFASDAELPALLDRTLTDSLTPAQIKRAVTDWQADWMRV